MLCTYLAKRQGGYTKVLKRFTKNMTNFSQLILSLILGGAGTKKLPELWSVVNSVSFSFSECDYLDTNYCITFKKIR